MKLTDYGIRILAERREELNRVIQKRGGKGLGSFNLHVDAEGYYKAQGWALMETFGPHIGLGRENPFELDIVLTNTKKE